MEMLTISVKKNDFKQPNVLRENIVQSLCDYIVDAMEENGDGTYSLMISPTSRGAYRVFVQLNNNGSVFKLSSTLANYETNAIKVTTMEGDVTANYFTYMKKHQKQNPLMAPFGIAKEWVNGLFEDEGTIQRGTGSVDINPFKMNRKDYALMQKMMDNIHCSVDKKTSVITINVTDQDPLVCATMADSVKSHLQAFIIRYRTSKATDDVMHYQQMRDSAEHEYDMAMEAYSRFCDAHKDIVLQSFQSERDKLESELSIRQNTLGVMEAQLQSSKVKLQEKTPAFTTLKSATVPVKPAGPKRMIFVLGMLIFASLITVIVVNWRNFFS